MCRQRFNAIVSRGQRYIALVHNLQAERGMQRRLKMVDLIRFWFGSGTDGQRLVKLVVKERNSDQDRNRKSRFGTFGRSYYTFNTRLCDYYCCLG